jgi:phenylalanyl-tRNA synthetase beta chain
LLRLSKLKGVLGIDVPADEAVRALERLGFSPHLVDGRIDVTVPHWRLDVNIEADLVEEVARVIGYGRIPMRDEIAIRLQPQDMAAKSVEAIRDTLVAGGYFEAVTFSFVSDSLAEDFKPSEAAGLPRADAAVRKADAHLRPSIIPGLLESLARNENNGNMGVKFYELGSTFWADAGGVTQERRRVGLVGSGDLHEVRGVVEAILNRLNADCEVHILPDRRQGFAAGAAARVEWGGTPIGWLGKVDRAVAEKLSLREVPAAAELDLHALIQGARHVPQLKPLPKFPPVTRDLSLVVAESVRYEQIEALVRSLRPEQLEEAEYVTTYRGKPLEKGQKSVTLKLVFRAADRTLTGDEVEAAVKRIVEGAAKELRATLRI